MKYSIPFLLLFLFSTVSPTFGQPKESGDKQQVRTFINLLDYIGKDYPNAVEDGAIVSQSEYQEMTDFSEQVATLYQQLGRHINKPGFSDMAGGIDHLKKAIAEMAPADTVAAIAGQVRKQILALKLITVTPQHWPNLAEGRQIFVSECQSCHGAEGFGNGPLAKTLDPVPTNFRDTAVAAKLSPLQAYNTIRLGIEGTAMRPFSELTNREAWDVAFYINALNYSQTVPDSTVTNIRRAIADTASLAALSLYTNEEWEQLLASRDIAGSGGMAVVRNMTGPPASGGSGDVLQKALSLLKKSEQAYLNKEYSAAMTFALNAYLDGFEPEETELRASDAALVKRVESEMLSIRSAIKSRIDNEQFKAKIASASTSLREAQQLLEGQQYTFWLNFLLAASILLREGLEAFLIIMIILNVLRSVGADRTAKFVHGGWIVAIILGIGGWLILQSFIQMSSMQRELMEGLGALIAVGMLLYIGFWMHSKTHANQWTRFIKERVDRLLDEGNSWGLALLAFVVVFREAFESIIFLSSISLKSSGGSNTGILLAFIVVAVVIAGIGYIYKRLAKRIPIRQLFRYSSFMLAVLAFILIGKGIRSLQEAGYIGISPLPINLDLPLLGLYDSWATLIGQLLVLAAIAGLWLYSNRLAQKQELQRG